MKYKMRKYVMRSAAAAVAAVMSTGYLPEIAPVLETAVTAYADDNTCAFQDGVLTLRGNVSKSEVQSYQSQAVTKVVAAEGAVLPADCSEMFRDFNRATTIDLSKADIQCY